MSQNGHMCVRERKECGAYVCVCVCVCVCVREREGGGVTVVPELIREKVKHSVRELSQFSHTLNTQSPW